MATLARVRERAAKRLGLLATGQTLGASITADLVSAYSGLHAEWTELGIAVWSSTADVPEKLAEAVVRELAYRLKDDYGISMERYQRIAAEGGQAAENMVRRLIAGEYVADTTEFVDY